MLCVCKQNSLHIHNYSLLETSLTYTAVYIILCSGYFSRGKIFTEPQSIVLRKIFVGLIFAKRIFEIIY